MQQDTMCMSISQELCVVEMSHTTAASMQAYSWNKGSLSIGLSLPPPPPPPPLSGHNIASYIARIITPRRACAARGKVIALGLDCISAKKKKKLKLKKYSLSEVHFNTGRLIFEFNGLQYCFAAGQVFMAFANPASVSFG